MKCIPVLWNELTRVKSRVESVLNALSNKAVEREKVLEFKKQLVSNKNLKDYFKQNPQEKDILLNDISKAQRLRADKFLFRALDIMPSYVIPEAMIATTPEQLAYCTIGCRSVLPGAMMGNLPQNKQLKNSFGNLVFADLDSSSRVI